MSALSWASVYQEKSRHWRDWWSLLLEFASTQSIGCRLPVFAYLPRWIVYFVLSPRRLSFYAENCCWTIALSRGVEWCRYLISIREWLRCCIEGSFYGRRNGETFANQYILGGKRASGSHYEVWVNRKIEHWHTGRQIRDEALSSEKIILSQWEGISRWLWWRCKVIFGCTVGWRSLAPRTPHCSESALNRRTRKPWNFLSAELKLLNLSDPDRIKHSKRTTISCYILRADIWLMTKYGYHRRQFMGFNGVLTALTESAYRHCSARDHTHYGGR